MRNQGIMKHFKEIDRGRDWIYGKATCVSGGC